MGLILLGALEGEMGEIASIPHLPLLLLPTSIGTVLCQQLQLMSVVAWSHTLNLKPLTFTNLAILPRLLDHSYMLTALEIHLLPQILVDIEIEPGAATGLSVQGIQEVVWGERGCIINRAEGIDAVRV